MHAVSSCPLGSETSSERPPGFESFAEAVLGLQEAKKKLVHAHEEEVARLMAELRNLRMRLPNSNTSDRASRKHEATKQGEGCVRTSRRLPPKPSQKEGSSFRRPVLQKSLQPQCCDEEPPRPSLQDAELQRSSPRGPFNIQIELGTPIDAIVHENSATAVTSCLRSALSSPRASPLKPRPKPLTIQRSDSSIATIFEGSKREGSKQFENAAAVSFLTPSSPSGNEAVLSLSPMSGSRMNQFLNTGDLGYTLRREWALDENSMQRKLFKVHATNSPARLSLERQKKFYWGSKLFGPSEGSVGSVYGRWEIAPLHPEGRPRLMWDIIASLLLAYDLVTRPLYFFDLPDARVLQVMDWVGAAYWVLDIFASLATGTYIQGELQLKIQRVIFHYAQTWMIFDILVCASDFALLAHGESRSLGTSLRMLRLLRLLRLVKLEKLLSKLADRTNSIIHLLMLKISFNMSLIVIIIHVLGSLWYAIGIDGWVEAFPWPSTDFQDRYFVSIHWCLTQFHGGMEVYPSNAKERMFAVGVLLLALIIFSWFVGSLTEALMKLQMVHSERTMHMKEVCSFLEQHQVSVPLTVQLKHYFIRRRSVRLQRQKDVMLLQSLSTSLEMDLFAEIRGALLVTHQFFWKLCRDFPRLVRQLCQKAIEERVVSPSDVVFSTGDACNCTYLLERGCMFYKPAANLSFSGQLPAEDAQTGEMNSCWTHNSEVSAVSAAKSSSAKEVYSEKTNVSGIKQRIEQTVSRIVGHEMQQDVTLGRGDWISEASLWTHWENCGELTALSEGFIQMLQAEVFAELIYLYEKAHMEAALYASAFITYLNRVFPSDVQASEFISHTIESAECTREKLKAGADIEDASP